MQVVFYTIITCRFLHSMPTTMAATARHSIQQAGGLSVVINTNLNGPWSPEGWFFPWYPQFVNGTKINGTLMLVRPQ